MNQHEFGECCDKAKLVWHGMFDTKLQELSLKDHIRPDSLKEALCPECYSRWVETERLKQVIQANLNYDWPTFVNVAVDLEKRFNLIDRWRQ